MDTVKIDARDVNFWYGDFHALKGISMQIEEKSVVAFMEPSGGVCFYSSGALYP